MLDSQYLRHYALTRGFMLGRPVQAKPTSDGKAVLFLRAQARTPELSLYEFDVATGKTRELLTPEQVLQGTEEKLSAEEKARRERQRVSVGGFTNFQLSEDGSLVLLSLSGKLYVYDRSKGKVRQQATGSGALVDPKFSPDGNHVSYVRGYDIFIFNLSENKETRITSGGSENKTHGLAEFVAQEEMGRFTGYWWAPNSKSVAFEESDAEGVEKWFVSDPAKPEQPPHPSYYPRPGKANVKVRLGIIAITGGDPLWVDWDRKKYPYLTQVRWDKSGPLAVQVESRDQKELALLLVDSTDGKTSVLVTERDATWINLHQEVPRWSEDGKTFCWISEREGGPQLEMRSIHGDLKRVLVPPSAGFQTLVDMDAKTGQIVYLASLDPTQSHLFRLENGGDKSERLTEAAGLHSAVFAKDHSIYIHQESLSGAMPRRPSIVATASPSGSFRPLLRIPALCPKRSW
ncbi:MAG: DPP IV N-terminal domain-containing protein [Gemmataceae bacterium]